VADGRIDFRELVKRLAKEFQTRIEMRQIGSRDEAKLAVDYEACGLECCCKRFLKSLKPVNMRMAKLQKATLDPSKISGHCGRLKCCLRYEDETYRELKTHLPKKNTKVRTPYGDGTVADTHILTQLVVVQKKDGPPIVVPVEEIEVVAEKPADDEKKPSKKQDKEKNPDTPNNKNNEQDQTTNANEPEKPPSQKESNGA
jgi:cell fate regulator YaaT (PSP1 superfamily)